MDVAEIEALKQGCATVVSLEAQLFTASKVLLQCVEAHVGDDPVKMKEMLELLNDLGVFGYVTYVLRRMIAAAEEVVEDTKKDQTPC